MSRLPTSSMTVRVSCSVYAFESPASAWGRTITDRTVRRKVSTQRDSHVAVMPDRRPKPMKANSRSGSNLGARPLRLLD